MATYYLISTTSGKYGYQTYGEANNKKELEELADDLWLNSKDIYDETLYKNYKILSKTSVVKMLGKRFLDVY